jgi:hypothetical protein
VIKRSSFSQSERERENDKERERENDKEREREREKDGARERCRIWLFYFDFKRNDGCLDTF